jgi:hypothetical protein
LLCPAALVRTDVSEEALGSSETSVVTRATRRNNPQYGVIVTLLRSRSSMNQNSLISYASLAA